MSLLSRERLSAEGGSIRLDKKLEVRAEHSQRRHRGRRSRSPRDPWRLSPRSSERWLRLARGSAPAAGAPNRAETRESRSPSSRRRGGRAEIEAVAICRPDLSLPLAIPLGRFPISVVL